MGDLLNPCPGSDPTAVATDVPPQFVMEVLGSRTFERAPTLRTLLLYLWNHRGESRSEYAVATEALGRRDNFSSKIDATVRVQISRLRQRLETYYDDEGQSAQERLFIPLGSHEVDVREVEITGSEIGGSAVGHAPWTQGTRPVRFLMAACALLSVAVGLMAVRINQPASAARPTVPRFWRTFFSNGLPTRIILPTPVFFSWRQPSGQQSSLMVRDTDINLFEAASQSSSVRAFEERYGRPTLGQSYTVTSDTFASVRLARYLDRLSFPTNVMSSASAPLDALDRENVIALGTWGTLTPLKVYLDKMSFELSQHETLVTNRAPTAGEPGRLQYQVLSQERTVWPGVIAVLPGRENRTRLLILAGRHTSALVTLLTSREGQDQLEPMWKAKGSPDFFDLAVEAEMNGDTLVGFSAKVLHRFDTKPDSARQ